MKKFNRLHFFVVFVKSSIYNTIIHWYIVFYFNEEIANRTFLKEKLVIFSSVLQLVQLSIVK